MSQIQVYNKCQQIFVLFQNTVMLFTASQNTHFRLQNNQSQSDKFRSPLQPQKQLYQVQAKNQKPITKRNHQITIKSAQTDRIKIVNLTRLHQYSTLLIIFLFFLQISQIQCRCQKTALQYPNAPQNYDTCEMCYFQFSSRLYFLKCQKRVNCTKSSLDTLGDQTEEFFHLHNQCKQSSLNVYDVTQCQKLCCDHFSQSTQQLSRPSQFFYTNEYCQSLKQYQSKVFTLTLVVVLVPLCFLAICLLFHCLCTRPRNNNTLAGMFGHQDESYIDENQIKLDKFRIEEIGPHQMNSEENCSICLDNQCNVYTACGHWYHPRCFREWLVKRPRCPICMAKKYNPAKIYCKSCKVGVMFEIFGRAALKDEDFKKLNYLQNTMCQSCKNNPQKKEPKKQIEKSLSRNKVDGLAKFPTELNDEEHISIIEFSQQFDDKKKHQEEKISNSLTAHPHKKREINYNGSIRDYISSFKRTKQRTQTQQIDATPQKNKQNMKSKQFQLEEQVRQTPQKLLYTEDRLQEKDCVREFQ